MNQLKTTYIKYILKITGTIALLNVAIDLIIDIVTESILILASNAGEYSNLLILTCNICLLVIVVTKKSVDFVE